MKTLAKDIYYVGVCNPTLRIFDIIMETKYGTTYNAYLIKDKHNTLIDTVHSRFDKDYINNIEEILPVSEIKYLVCNHAEPDHTGSISLLLDKNPNITIIGTNAALKNIGQIVNRPFNSLVVKDGDTLNIGENTLKFISAPNLHWPDTMFTYLESRKIIFTCDFLATHYGEPDIFDTTLKYKEKFISVIKDYYDAIFSPFKKFVLQGLDKIAALDIDIVAVSHGPILTEQKDYIMTKYREWSQDTLEPMSATIAYVSAYCYTKRLAETFEKELNALGVKTYIFDAVETDTDTILKAIEKSKLILLGSCTINRDALKPILDILSNLDAISNKGKNAFAFGSYGWSGEAVDNIEARLTGLGLKIASPGLKVLLQPTQTDFDTVKTIAKDLVEKAFK